MTSRPFLLSLFLTFCSLLVTGQTTIKGTVTDQRGVPLSYATVILQNRQSNGFLGYTATSDSGEFLIQVDTLPPCYLVTRLLGKATDTTYISANSELSNLKIILLDSSNDLPEIEVKTDRKAVGVKNDTSTYNFGTFRDSLDRSVEDVLRKIPGIEVAENGSISVNGKKIETILVEDSDLFGMDYQLGSKNIRARDIATVEAIDHYQRNAALQSVNLSDAIVLNLRLREDKKSIISGEISTSLGGARQLPYQLYLPLYRISRKHKSFLLLNTDRLAADVGFTSRNEVSTASSSSLRQPLFTNQGFHSVPMIDQVGLPAIYTDNTQTSAAQLREHLTFGASTVLITLTGVRNEASQQLSSKTTFTGLTDDYQLENTTAWQHQKSQLAGEGEYTYTAPSKKFTVEAYGKIDSDHTSFDRSATGNAPALDTMNGQTDQLLFRAIISQQVGDNAVVQFSTAHQKSDIGENSRFLQQDLIPLFTNFPTGRIAQRLNYQQTLTTTDLALLKKVGNLTLRTSLFGQKERTMFQNSLNENNGNARFNDYGATTFLRYTRRKMRYDAAVRYAFNQQNRPEYSFTGSLEKAITAEDALRIKFSHRQLRPDIAYLLNEATYLSGPFAISATPLAEDQPTVTSLSLSRRFKNTIKLRSGFLSVRAIRTTGGFTREYDFIESISRTIPVTGANSLTTTLSGGYSFFSTPLKSDVKLRLATTLETNEYLDGDRPVDYSSVNYSARGETSWAISRRIRVRTNLRAQYTQALSGINFNNFNLTTSSQLLLTYPKNRLYLGIATVSNTGSSAKNGFVNGFIGGETDFSVGDRSISFSIRLYNPINQRVFRTQSFNDLYLNVNSVATTGTVGYLTLSTGL